MENLTVMFHKKLVTGYQRPYIYRNAEEAVMSSLLIKAFNTTHILLGYVEIHPGSCKSLKYEKPRPRPVPNPTVYLEVPDIICLPEGMYPATFSLVSNESQLHRN